MISIHALLAESDFGPISAGFIGGLFLSTLSLRRATTDMRHRLIELGFLSTLSLRRATVNGGVLLSCFGNFYPRSPCGERRVLEVTRNAHSDFYPRSPCGERHDTSSLMRCQTKFLSTLSLRRATPSLCFFWCRFCHFYPRSPCGERHFSGSAWVQEFPISIHALLAESDSFGANIAIPTGDFYPRSPCGERQCSSDRGQRLQRNFYPRSPCGERRQWRRSVKLFRQFLSTLSLRRATVAPLLATGGS